jgi:hypothetical protein
VAHSDPAVRCLGDGQERVIFPKRQVVLDAKFLVKTTRDPLVRQEEGAPWCQAWVARLEWSIDWSLGGRRRGM